MFSATPGIQGEVVALTGVLRGSLSNHVLHQHAVSLDASCFIVRVVLNGTDQNAASSADDPVPL